MPESIGSVPNTSSTAAPTPCNCCGLRRTADLGRCRRTTFFAEPPDEDDIQLAERAVLLWRAVLLLSAAPLMLGVWAAARVRARHRATAANVPAKYSTAPSHNKLGIAFASAAYALTIWVFIKNAWVTEDAYIIFRSVEQVFAGNGPVWNPHERVQAFTSPLWFGVLVLTRNRFFQPLLEYHRRLLRPLATHRQESPVARPKPRGVRAGRFALHRLLGPS